MKLTVFALLIAGTALVVLTVVFRSGMQQFELDPPRHPARASTPLATVSDSAIEKPIQPWLKKAHRSAYSAPRHRPAQAEADDKEPAFDEPAVEDEEYVGEESVIEEPVLEETAIDAIALQAWVEELEQRELALLTAEEQWQVQQEQALRDQQAWLNEQPDTLQTREAFAELMKVWEAAASEHETFLVTQREQIEADLAWLLEQERAHLEAVATTP